LSNRQLYAKLAGWKGKESMLYWLAKAITIFYIRTNRIPIVLKGEENIPRKGPAIFASRHENNFDWAVTIRFVPFPVHFMFKYDAGRPMRVLMFKYDTSRLVRVLMTLLLRMFTVRRFGGSNAKAFGKAVRLLSKGGGVGVFPEGTRGPNLRKAHNGVGYLAARSGCQVIPVAVSGTVSDTEGLLRLSTLLKVLVHPWQEVTVTFCEPVDPKDFGNDHKAITEEVMRRIAEQLPKAERGYYADKVGEGGNAP